MELVIGILKVLGLFIGSVVVIVNLELLPMRIAALLGLGKFYEKNDHPTITEFIVFFIVIAGIILSFWLTGIVYGYFGIGGRIWALAVYLLLDLNNSVLSLLGMTKNAYAKKPIIYSDEMYPVFAGRFVGFIAAFILLFFGIV